MLMQQQQKNIYVLPWPTVLPDMVLIKHISDAMERLMCKNMGRHSPGILPFCYVWIDWNGEYACLLTL